MTKLCRRLTVPLVSVAMFVALPARAQQATASAPAYGPTTGSYELRLENTWYAGTFPLGNGFSHQAPERGSNTNLLSFGASLGYFAAPNVELGGGASYVNLDGDIDIVGVTGFARYFSMLTQRLAGYGGAGALFQVAVPDMGSTQKLYGLGVDAGIEEFVTVSWAVRLGVTYRHLWLSRANTPSTTQDALGVTWGIAAYF